MSSPEESKPGRGCLRWAGGLLVLLAFVLATYRVAVESGVAGYEKRAKRDPETKVMLGYEPIIFHPERRDRAVLLVHGFIGSPQNYNTLPQAIADAGWRVEAMLLPGCGTTPHDHEAAKFPAIIAGVEDRLKALQAECETVVIVGHSQGGALATLAAASCQPQALIAVAPFYGLGSSRAVDGMIETVARATSPVLRWLPGTRKPPINLAANYDKILDYGWVSTKAAISAMETCNAVYDREVWKQITMPTMVIHSRNDKVTNSAATEALFPRFASTEKEIHWLEKSNHVYFWDYDEDEVNRLVLEFLKKREGKAE
jgi:carboxylesterase